MVEFGRAPTLCAHCGPSHILVREDVTPDTLLSCLTCFLPVGRAAEVCGRELFSFPDLPPPVALGDTALGRPALT